MGHLHHVGHVVQILLLHGGVIDDDSVVKVTALDEVELDERQHLANEHKRAAGGNLLLELADVGQRSKLIAQHGRVKLDHAVNRQIIVRKHNKRRTCLFVNDLDALLHDVELFFGLLLDDAGFLDFLAPDDGAAVKDGHLAAIHLDQAVVNARSIQGGHGVLNGAHASLLVALVGNDGAARGFDDVLGQCLYGRLAFKVHALEHVTGVHIGRLERRC